MSSFWIFEELISFLFEIEFSCHNFATSISIFLLLCTSAHAQIVINCNWDILYLFCNINRYKWTFHDSYNEWFSVRIKLKTQKPKKNSSSPISSQPQKVSPVFSHYLLSFSPSRSSELCLYPDILKNTESDFSFLIILVGREGSHWVLATLPFIREL